MESEKLPTFIKNVQKDPSHGHLYDLLLPCGNKVTIREQNGNDDDIISSFNKGEIESNPFNRFVASLIVKHDFPFTKNEKLSINDVLQIPLRSKYFIIIASRIFSIGETLIFEWDWKNGDKPVEYEDNLSDYLWDYEITFPEPGDPLYHKERIKPYTKRKEEGVDAEHIFDRVFELNSGKIVKFNLMNGKGENYLLKLPIEKRSANAELKARDLSIWIEDKYIKIETFKGFTSREMAEIRRVVDSQDSVFDGLTTIENPYSGEESQLPLLHIPDFFFPREI